MDTTKAITHLSLCSGYEGIGLGLRRVLPNLREIAYVEREGFVIANLVAKMEAGELDAAPVFTDVKTSSLEDSRASHSQLLESVKLLKTPDTCSPTSQTESESANLELFFLKTYKESSPAKQETENPFSNMSLESWKDWVTEQRQEYSQRKKLAHLTRENESSSQPTATVFDTTGGSYPTEMVDGVYRSKHSQEPNSPWYGAKLKDAVETHEENWSTPTVMDTANIQKPRKKNPSGGQKPPLCQEVKNWPTASARDQQGSPRDNGGEPRASSQSEQSQSGGGHSGSLRDSNGQAEPRLGRASNGSTSRVDRLRLLGNGVVPQTAAKAFATLINILI